MTRSRREFLRSLGVSAAALPFVLNLPGLAFANSAVRKKRLVIMFSPVRRHPVGILAGPGRRLLSTEGKFGAARTVPGSDVDPARRLRQNPR